MHMGILPVRLSHVFVALTAFTFSGGCSHTYYSPNAHHVLGFREAGEVQLQVHGNILGKEDAVDVQGAFSLTDHFCLIASHQSLKVLDHFHAEYHLPEGVQNPYLQNKASFNEFGVGYFVPLSQTFTVQMLTLVGSGSQVHRMLKMMCLSFSVQKSLAFMMKVEPK